ncbi:hypothetical protein BDV26DRAFT_261875 [Aspergillus bertholletiae]|uniref:Zn(2)-C6 fungal-type domain-containing protein n=1 Tax=Aspergillus bertholletiae TaxID=1226010 RepID=A0A5N7B932_9EURO|nr:hypothetical protein BDV26DRAFT_261875 [Aspergillus bertholletiae]
MKRWGELEMHKKSRKRVTRQDPVSCESCRRKKLKCNRQQPCSSCITRRLPCSYGVASDAAHTQRAESENGGQSEAIVPVSRSTFGLQEERSEDTRPFENSQPSHRNRESLRTANWLENIHMGDRVPTATPKSLRDELNELRDMEYCIAPAVLLTTSSRRWNASRENPATVDLLSFLPDRDEAMIRFKYYIDYIDYLYHIIFPKRVQDQIDGIYRAIENGQPPNLSHVALLFSIAASSSFLQPSMKFSSCAELFSREFSFLTGAALIQSNHLVNPTVEGLQAAMMIMHHASNMNCHPSVSSLFIHAAIVSQAKNLKLHCIDSPQSREEREANPPDAVELETKRRLWWDITSYDWFLGFLSGPQEWTYLVNPDHMKVNWPLNLDDKAIKGFGEESLPIWTPTDMSFSIERLKLGIVCREVIDATSHEHLSGIEVSYQKILELDRKFNQALAEVPEFFRLDPISRRQFASLYQDRPTIAWQRCLLQQGYFSRLCRLHRNFFIRGAREPEYSYSHVVCLQSARKVLEIKRIMDEDEPKFTPPSSIVWSVMHHVFMATVILMLDVCFNWDDILAEKRKEEVLEACRIVDSAQISSSLVKEGIKAMMGVLQKHWKNGKPPASPNLNSFFNRIPTSVDAPRQTLPTTVELDPPSNFPTNVDDTPTPDPQLEDIWSDMLDSSTTIEMGDTDWTGLLSELTKATVPHG